MLSNPINFHKYFINSRTNKNIIKKNKIFTQQRNRLQSSSLHSIPSTNIFCIPHKCIHMYIHEEFAIRSHIQAYKGDVNVYGPLWTPTCICAMWTYFLIILYVFSSLKRLYHPLHHRQSHDRLSPSPQHHVWLHPPIFSCLVNILLLFVRTFSPLFTCINRVGTMLYSILIWVLCSLGQQLSESWNRLHCSLQAFGYYCQQLPGLNH